MKSKVRLPKSIRITPIREAKKGDSFVVDGHQASATAAFIREGVEVFTNRAWLVLMSSDIKPVPVTIITVK